MPRPATLARAFTMAELLVVLGIVAVVAALLTPGLARVRQRARVAASLANLRSHATVIAAYTSDWRDALPYFSNPRGPRTVLHCSTAPSDYEVPYFGPTFAWPFAMADGYYGGRYLDPSFRSPLFRSGAPADYLMPCTFMADPRFWTRETREVPPAQLRGVRLAEVVFPVAKCAMLEGTLDSRQRMSGAGEEFVHLSCIDGRAMEVPASKLMPGEERGDGFWQDPYYRMHRGTMFAPLHTLNGVHGRDVK